MKKILATICITGVAFFAKGQQEPHYTQNQFNSNLLLNPAYAGSAPCASIGFRYRNQWSGFEGAPKTLSFIGESKIARRLGGGITLDYDKIGIDKTFTVDGNVAYHLPVGASGRIGLGFKFGASFLSSDFSKLTGVNTVDPLYANDNKVTIPFIGVGLLYYNEHSYAGISLPRLASFETAGTRSKIAKQHYYLYGGHRFVFDNGFDLRPALMARYEAEAPLQFDFATDLWFQNIIGIGVAYRSGDAVDFMLKGKVKALYVGYSYDMTVSGLRSFNHGTHELFVGYEFCHKKEESDPRNDNIRHF